MTGIFIENKRVSTKIKRYYFNLKQFIQRKKKMQIFPEIIFWVIGTLVFWFTLLFLFSSAIQSHKNDTLCTNNGKRSSNRVKCELVVDEKPCPSAESTFLPVKTINCHRRKKDVKETPNKVEELIVMIFARIKKS